MRAEKARDWRVADRSWFRKLDEQCFPIDDPFMNGPRYHWWILRDGRGKKVGYAGLVVTGDTAQFTRCGILPEHRGRNLQRVLLKSRLRWCRRQRLRVVTTYTMPDNVPSQRNLELEGFSSRRSPDRKYILHRLEL
jgi:GNAT superfamily N-acetyltransferase